MKKLIPFLLIAIFLLSACTRAGEFDVSMQTWEEFPPEEEGSIRPIIKMNSILDPNLFFKLRYHPDHWEIKETKGRHRTAFIFNNVQYDDETCYVLPGAVGYEVGDFIVEQWSFRSTVTWGIDYEFSNPVTGIAEMRVFQADSNGAGFPVTLFELHLPSDEQDQTECVKNYENLISTYEFDYYSGTPEELQTKLDEIESISEATEETQ